MNEWDHDVYARYSGDVYRFALYLCGNEAQAEDVVAETFVKLWTSRAEIRTPTLKAYLFTIARRLCVDLARRQRRVVALEDDVPSRVPSPEQIVLNRSRLAGVWKQLHQNLSDEDRAALLMRTVGLTYDEIAESLRISGIAAKVRVHRARKKLLRLIET